MVNALIAIHVIGKEKKLDFLNQALEKFLLILESVFLAKNTMLNSGG